jgi:copper chaperone CopZ
MKALQVISTIETVLKEVGKLISLKIDVEDSNVNIKASSPVLPNTNITYNGEKKNKKTVIRFNIKDESDNDHANDSEQVN